MSHEFVSKLERILVEHSSHLVLRLRPRLSLLPEGIRRFDEPFLPFGKALINASRDLVCAYVFDFASYLALGAAGVVALERTIAYISGEVLCILHGPFVGPDYGVLFDETALNVDALVLANSQYLGDYLRRPDRCVFVANNNPNPQLRDAPDNAGIYWNTSDQLTILGTQGQVIVLQIVGDDVVYRSAGDDFDKAMRVALEEMRHALAGG